MEYKELMDAFAAHCGLSGAEVKDGILVLEIDDMTFSFIENPTEDSVTVYGVIGRPPQNGNALLEQMLLRANHLFAGTGGAVLCQDPESENYALFRQFPLVSLDAKSFADDVEKLVNLVAEWRRILSGVATVEESVRTANDWEPKQSPLSTDGFMRV